MNTSSVGLEIFAGNNRNINILFNKLQASVSVAIFSLNGLLVTTKTYQHSASITLTLNSGTFIVRVVDENMHAETKMIMLK